VVFFANVLQPLIDFFEAILKFFHDTVGFGWGSAIVALTVIVRAALLPLTLKQFKSMQNMAKFQPEIKRLQERYKGDRERLNQEMMKFYRENKVNPFASCLPLVAQLPVFLALFYMLRKDLRHDICPTINPPEIPNPKPCGETAASQFLFIPDLTDKATGSVLIALIVLYVGSQLLSTVLMSTATDRTQRFIFLALPFFFVAFVISFPAGLLGLPLERQPAAFAVAGRVDLNLGRRRLAVRRHLEREMLHGVDRLAVASDEETHVVTVQDPPDPIRLLEDLHFGVQLQSVVDVLEQLAHSFSGRIGSPTHRRLPDRFFFLRGDGGGGADGRLFGAGFEPAPPPAGTGRAGGVAAPSPPRWSVRSIIDMGGPSPSAEGGRIGPRRLRTIVCWMIVQKFVVIQYTSRPAGKLITKATKKNGSARKMNRCVRSVAVDMSTVESNCDPT